MDFEKYWECTLNQDAEEMRKYFTKDAHINWHCTNEHFTVEEFIRANCEYPGKWAGEIERKEICGDSAVTAVHVYEKNGTLSFHVVSFFQIREGKIVSLDEYWGDDGLAPEWRQEKQLGSRLRK